jgi:hypothetical protein
MRASGGKQALVAKHLAMLDVEHMHRMLVVELIDLAPIRLGECQPISSTNT